MDVISQVVIYHGRVILVHFKFTHLPIYDEMEKLTFAGTVASVSECGCLVPLLSAA